MRFLFVGGLIGRKGPDVLLDAFMTAFAGRDDVTLVIKDFGAQGVYRGPNRDRVRQHAASRALPRIVYIDDDLSADQMAALYRACDVLVHPYRGEGFAMPVLEAMACGLPAIVTAGGPTDEFCPDSACWRIAASRATPNDRFVGELETVRLPWVLEPSREHLHDLLRQVADDVAGRRQRGRAARAAAEHYTWQVVGAQYRQRIDRLASGPARSAAPDPAHVGLADAASRRLLAAPRWRDDDGLAALLGAWSEAAPTSTDACLYLLADPAVHGSAEVLGARVVAAAAQVGVDLEAAADVTLVSQTFSADGLQLLHAATGAYVPLTGSDAAHRRLATVAGSTLVAPTPAALATWLATPLSGLVAIDPAARAA